MSRALALFTYKLRFFFGPSLRGRFGPFAYLALIAIFLPSAYFTGLGLGMAVRTLDADEALAVLSAPLAAALPMFGILAAYSALVLLTSQVLVVLRVRYPKIPVRLLTMLLFGFSLIPALGIVRPDFPIRFTNVPIPSTAFASLGLAILRDAPPSLVDLAVAAAYLIGVALVWWPLSNAYVFHGLKPTMSAGFGQMDLGSRMGQ